jgi:hypothetical protein
MKRLSIKQLFSFLLLFTLISCQKDDSQTKTFSGPQVQMGNGKARSWIKINDGVPQEIAIEMTAGALQNLPTGAEHHEESSFILPLHQKASSVTPYDHLTIDWSPQGHPPPGIYDAPHFDFHFYMISVAEQLAIPPPPAGLFDINPPPGYLPADYVIDAGGVPQMGKHWIDRTSPELPPSSKPFTYTLIYGSYNGKVTFHEPMVTRQFLLSGTEVHAAIKQPQLYSKTNTYYPTQFNIYKDSSGKIYISLSKFVWR